MPYRATNRSLRLGLLAVFLAMGASAWAWIPPSGDDQPGDTHVPLPADGGYCHETHGYVLERAIDILRNDGHHNYAAFLQGHRQDLIDGVRYGDKFRSNFRLAVKARILFWYVTLVKFDLPFSPAAVEHYYNPDTQKGLHLEDWIVVVKSMINVVFDGIAYWTGGLISFRFDSEPAIVSDYRSAPDLAQELYARALARFQGAPAAPTPPGWDYGAPSSRTETQQAMFHLGWVCHLIGDMGVIHHTFDSLFEKHNDYEDAANGLGRVDGLHAATSRFYRLDWSASDYAISLATAVHDPELWQRVKNGEPEAWDAGISLAVPLTEEYLAGVMWKFCHEAGIPDQPVLTALFLDDQDQAPVPGAYLFYRKANDTTGPWQVLRADAAGRVEIAFAKPGTAYLFRPAMPGYDFLGHGDILLESPVRYEMPSVTLVAPEYHFFLRPPTSVSSVVWAGEESADGEMVDFTGQLQLTSGTTLIEDDRVDLRAPIRGTLSVKWDRSDLGVEAPGSVLPPMATIDIAVQSLVDLVGGARVRSVEELAAREPLTTAERVDAEVIGRNLQRLTEEGTLTTMTVVYADGVARPYLDFASQGLDGEESFALLAKGIVAAPSMAGVEIEVRVLPGEGFLGDAAAAPLRLTTDASGRARCLVYAGSRAGSLRVEVRVVNNPWGHQLTTSKRVDLLVHPSLSGADAPTLTTPRLFSLFVVSGFVAPW